MHENSQDSNNDPQNPLDPFALESDDPFALGKRRLILHGEDPFGVRGIVLGGDEPGLQSEIDFLIVSGRLKVKSNCKKRKKRYPVSKRRRRRYLP